MGLVAVPGVHPQPAGGGCQCDDPRTALIHISAPEPGCLPAVAEPPVPGCVPAFPVHGRHDHADLPVDWLSLCLGVIEGTQTAPSITHLPAHQAQLNQFAAPYQ